MSNESDRLLADSELSIELKNSQEREVSGINLGGFDLINDDEGDLLDIDILSYPSKYSFNASSTGKPSIDTEHDPHLVHPIRRQLILDNLHAKYARQKKPFTKKSTFINESDLISNLPHENSSNLSLSIIKSNKKTKKEKDEECKSKKCDAEK